MITTLYDTSAREIVATLQDARRFAGGGNGMVLTMLVPTGIDKLEQVCEAVLQAGKSHPSRIVVLVSNPDADPCLDAEVRAGADIPGEIVTATLSGELAAHPASVALPLILPDCPVVAWWPFQSPVVPAQDPIGRLAGRRITDAVGADDELAAIDLRARNLNGHDTDLAWTRLTHWRALLAAALDQVQTRVFRVRVEAERVNSPADLLAAWLEARLGVDVERVITGGPGLTGVRLTTADGEISVQRTDGFSACYSLPGYTPRIVALKRRTMTELITEELRLLDADTTFEQATAQLLVRRERLGR